jgi:hypothetical protein
LPTTKLMRYWSFGGPVPWPGILTKSSEAALRDGSPEHYALPLPELDQGGNVQYLFDAGGQGLVDWWLEVKRLWRQRQSEIPAARWMQRVPCVQVRWFTP